MKEHRLGTTNLPRTSALAMRASWALPRLLAACASLVVSFAVWSPWLVATLQPAPDAPSRSFYLDATGGIPLALMLISGPGTNPGAPISMYPRATFVINVALIVVSALGILLAPLLWQRTRTRALRLALIAYGLWLVTAAVVPLGLEAASVVALVRLYHQAGRAAVGTTYSPGFGLLLLLAGLVLGWIALVLLARQRDPTPDATSTALVPTRQSSRWAGLALVSAGLAVWGVGFLAVPWAQVNCSAVPVTFNHFVEGACAGLDAGDALSALVASRVAQSVWDWYGGIYALYGVLIGGGLLALVALWRRWSSLSTRIWLVIWLATATVVSALSYRGVSHIAAEAPVLSVSATGAWRGATGIPMAWLGLFLAWLGLVALDTAARRRAAPVSTSMAPATAVQAGASALPLHQS
jgi:hypothetical protein